VECEKKSIRKAVEEFMSNGDGSRAAIIMTAPSRGITHDDVWLSILFRELHRET